MAYDIVLGIIKKSWARDEQPAPAAPATPAPAPIVLTPDEKDKLAKIAALRMKAESGDRKAQKQWRLLSRRAAALGKKARQGDPKAKRMVEVINQSGVLGPIQRISGLVPAPDEPRDQDIIDKLILRAGNFAGWPIFVSKDRYADYQNRAGKGDQRSKEVLAILDRYIKLGKVKVSDEKKGQIISYPIGGGLCADDIAAAADGGACERAALARRIRSSSISGSPRHDRMIAQLHLAQRAASTSPTPYPLAGYNSSSSPGDRPSPPAGDDSELIPS